MESSIANVEPAQPVVLVPALPLGREILYGCVSEQLHGVLKCGGTARTAQVRAWEFSDIAKVMRWRVAFVVLTHAWRPAERLAKQFLDADSERYLEGIELWHTTPERARAHCQEAASLTPAPLRAQRCTDIRFRCVPQLGGEAWGVVLAKQILVKPLSSRPLTIGELLGCVLDRRLRHPAERALRRQGIELIRYDPDLPRFRFYADSDGPLTGWLSELGLTWQSLGCNTGQWLDSAFEVVAA